MNIIKGFVVASVLVMGSGVAALAQEGGKVVRGTWTATSSTGLAFTGSWSAAPHPQVVGAVHGAWALVDKSNRTTAQGTWSAEKDDDDWLGSWSARTPSNRVYSGTWRATTKDMKGRTLIEMLQQTLTSQVSGTWRYGPLTGNWWLGN